MYLLSWIVTLVILAFPVLTISLHNAGNGGLVLLLMCSAVAGTLGVKPMGLSFSTVLKRYWPLHIAMAGLLFSVLLNQAASGNFELKHYDRALRLAIFAPAFWIMLLVPLRKLQLIQWAFVAGVIVAVVKAYLFTHGGAARPSNIGFLLIIAFSDISLLLGTMAILSIGWNDRRQIIIILLKILAFCIGIYITVITGTRGSWSALPMISVFCLFYFWRKRLWTKLIFAIPAVFLLGAVFLNNDHVQSRVAAAITDITQYEQGKNMNGSIGMRFQMWRAAWLIFKEQPIFGIGRGNYSKEVKELAERGIMTPGAAHFAHPHNELLFNMAISGVFGLVAILAVYVVPAGYFVRDITHRDEQIRTAAGLGLILCICFFIYGLTDVMFFWTALGSFYTMSVATFFACIIKRKEELRITT